MPNLRWQELLILVGILVLLFGAKRLPETARGLGRSLRIFKAETQSADAVVEPGQDAVGIEPSNNDETAHKPATDNQRALRQVESEPPTAN